MPRMNGQNISWIGSENFPNAVLLVLHHEPIYLVMNKRPKIKLELTTTDKAVEILGRTAILAIWILTITNYTTLPDTIFIHYNGAAYFCDKIN